MKSYALIIAILSIAGSSFAQGTVVSYKDADASLQGYFVKAKSNKAKAPGIVIVHQWMGLSDHEKGAATKIAALGYHAFAADIYGTGNMPKTPQEAGEKAGYYRNNPTIFQSRIKAAITQIVKQGADPDNIVVMGYCFGGTGALEAARAAFPVKGVISFHGGLGKQAERKNGLIKARVLVLHGADDPFVPKADIDKFQEEMKEGKADWQMIYYSNAVHAFTDENLGSDNSKGAAYNETAAKRSWEHMKLFLQELFM
ncbi:dienelactone hydrolase family protein [Flavihumibacter sp. R14]|nr:dienelactone hydrolase family protein [Flavihumibacter soli]